MSIAKEIQTRSKYDPGIEVDRDKVLCLHRNENLFIPREWMHEFVRGVVSEVDAISYPEPNSLPLRCALAELYEVTPEQVFVGNGSDEVLSDLLGLLRGRYKILSTLDVHFKVYDMLAERFNYEHRTIPGGTFATGRIDADGWNGLAIIDSPNSITGCHFEQASLLQLTEGPESFVIWDNAYGEFAKDTLSGGLPENMIMVRSFSKYFGLAGARVGYCIGSTDIIDQLLVRKDSFNVNVFGQQLALGALSRLAEFSRFRNAALHCRELLRQRLQDRQFDVRKSGGNYLFVSHRELSARYLEEKLLEQAVAVRRFAGGCTDNFLRLTVPPRKGIDRLMECLDRIIRDGQNA